MKKLMVIQHCGVVGGSGIGLLSVLEMLKKSFDIVIYCASTPDHLVKLYHKEGYTVRSVPYIPGYEYYSGGPGVFNLSFYISLSKLRSASAEWKALIQQEKPDIVLVNSMVLSWMWKAIKSGGAKAICHVREVLPVRSSIRARTMLNNLSHFDALWFISDHEKRFFNLSSMPTAVIRDCILPEASFDSTREHSPVDPTLFQVLYVGGASRLKGIKTLIRSLDYLDEEVKVIIAGHISNDRKFEKKKYPSFCFIKNLMMRFLTREDRKMNLILERALKKHPNNVRSVGHVINMGDLYAACDVLVFPSKAPHQSRPAFEAGFHRKPVIISDFVHTRESVKHKYNGLTFKPNHPKALAACINMLNRDRALCKQLGEHNLKNSAANYSFEAVKTQMDEFWSTYGTAVDW